MFLNELEIEDFFSGVDFFNRGEFREAHSVWEHLWKSIGNNSRRLPLKVFLQVTGAYANCYAGKQAGAQYLIKVALARTKEFEALLSKWVEVKDIISFLSKYQNKEVSLKVFHEIKIQKKWGRLHDDLGTE